MADPVFVFQLPEIDLRLGMQDKNAWQIFFTCVRSKTLIHPR